MIHNNYGTSSYLLDKNVYFFFQAEDGIRDLVRSRGLGDVYKRQIFAQFTEFHPELDWFTIKGKHVEVHFHEGAERTACLLYTSDAADERSSVDLGGRRIIKKKTSKITGRK
mgnify:CR=1 FL=1